MLKVTSVCLSLEDCAYVEFASRLLGLSRSQFLRDSSVANAIVVIRGQGRLEEFSRFLDEFRKKNNEVIKNDLGGSADEDDRGGVQEEGVEVGDGHDSGSVESDTEVKEE